MSGRRHAAWPATARRSRCSPSPPRRTCGAAFADVGVETFHVPFVHHTDDMVRQVEASLLSLGRLEKGDKVVIVAGSPPGTPGSTNALRVHTIGSAVSHAH
ncbi:pyruvate kinase alpha/beta domain-containing protein [Nonomuraea thailandensis]